MNLKTSADQNELLIKLERPTILRCVNRGVSIFQVSFHFFLQPLEIGTLLLFSSEFNWFDIKGSIK